MTVTLDPDATLESVAVDVARYVMWLESGGRPASAERFDEVGRAWRVARTAHRIAARRGRRIHPPDPTDPDNGGGEAA